MRRPACPPPGSAPRARAGEQATPLLPLFVKLAGRDVVVVGGGALAAARARQLASAGARVTVIAPEVGEDVAAAAATVIRREFRGGDLDGAWFAVAAATGPVNREVVRAAEARRILVDAVDAPEAASAFPVGLVRGGGAGAPSSPGDRARPADPPRAAHSGAQFR